MGRFSPRPHNLTPYLAGDSALTSGMMRGLTTATGIVDQGRRTSIAKQEADSREEMRDAQINSLENALLESQIQRAREWDYREEAPIIGEGPSSQQPQQVPGAETGIPRTQQMPVYAEGESSVDPGMARSPGQDVDPEMGKAPDDQSGDTGMAANPMLSLPYIQGTDHPGDRFPRVEVPGGSMLERPRSFHQKRGALDEAHGELYPGRDMSGVSESLAMGVDPYRAQARGGLSNEDWAWREDYKRDNEGPDVHSRTRAEDVYDSRASRYFVSAYEANGGDLDDAIMKTDAAFPGAEYDPNRGVTLQNSRRRRKESIVRALGMPPYDLGWWAIDQILDYSQGIEDVYGILSSHPDTRDQADAIKEWLGDDDRLAMLTAILGVVRGPEEDGT